MHDYSEHLEAPTEDAFAKLDQLLVERAKAEKVVLETTTKLKIATEALRDLAEKQLPELMRAMGIEQCTTSSGRIIQLKSMVYAALPTKDPARFNAGKTWLENNGLASLVRRKVTAELPMGASDLALKAMAALTALGIDQVDTREAVNAQQLSASVRSLLKEGSDVPMDLFGVWEKTEVKVK